jgi:hypothetical protein
MSELAPGTWLGMDGKVVQCEACHQEPAIGVACVPGIPYSAAYGRNCLNANIQPYGIVRCTVACAGGVDSIYPEYLDYTNVWCDGKVMTLREALVLHPMTDEELNPVLPDHQEDIDFSL